MLGAGVASVAGFGVPVALYATTLFGRRRDFTELFRTGEVARGVIVSVEAGPMYATFGYEFERAGVVHSGFMDYAQEMARFWGVGDAVPVLYDPNDPNRNCFVYR